MSPFMSVSELSYVASPKAKIARKMMLRNINPTAKPSLFPNALERRILSRIEITNTAILPRTGTAPRKYNNIHHPGLFTI
jgi:hypothetical protein